METRGKDGSPQEQVALSLLTAEGYDGQNCCISLHACLALEESEFLSTSN